jgi:hypothetical protein
MGSAARLESATHPPTEKSDPTNRAQAPGVVEAATAGMSWRRIVPGLASVMVGPPCGAARSAGDDGERHGEDVAFSSAELTP